MVKYKFFLKKKKEKLATKQQIALLKAFQAHKEGLTSF